MLAHVLGSFFARREKEIIRGLAKVLAFRYLFHVRSACAMDRGSAQLSVGFSVVPVV
jgi:hypothetical protein